jgi:hypothetical protein
MAASVRIPNLSIEEHNLVMLALTAYAATFHEKGKDRDSVAGERTKALQYEAQIKHVMNKIK